MADQIEWVLQETIDIPDDFKTAIGGHPLVAQNLYREGFKSIESALAFLDPEMYQPASPDELPDIEIAYRLLTNALQHQQQVLIWGDFDVDGQTATTILVEGLRELGGRVQYHVPIRAEESHGIKKAVLETYLANGFDLLLTCDTGISEHESIQYVRQAGVPVIVTDHHSLVETLPPANAVINPQRLVKHHPLRNLPGVGVAYKLMEGLFHACSKKFNAGKYLELVALGIVADVAELRNDTRFLLQQGLNQLRQTNRIALQTLYQNAALNPSLIDENHIGFQIAPRLNAVGRLGNANQVIEFLTTEDIGRARVLASHIEAMNAKRRFETRQVKKGAEKLLQSSPVDRHAPAIVLHHPTWPGGVIGIVASHLVEKYQKPAILLTGDDPIHGSARSVAGINITEIIASQSECLTGYGGHPMAAGLSLPKTNYDVFKQGILAEIEQRVKEVLIVPKLAICQEITLKEITLDLIEEIDRLAPFGQGNPRLNFLIRDLNWVADTLVGQNGEHRQVMVEDSDGNQQRIIWWNGGDSELPEAQFDLVCAFSKSDYKGTLQISVEWIDSQLSEKGQQDIKQRCFEIIDHRQVLSPTKLIKNKIEQKKEIAIWAEGNIPEGIIGQKRHELGKADRLIIWTAPPSQRILQQTLQKVKPHTLEVFGIDSQMDIPNAFMTRLAGLVKFAVLHKDGQASLEALAAACAAENETVRTGLLLWQALGKIEVFFEEDIVQLKIENKKEDQPVVDIYQNILNNLLQESRAYRRYFIQANLGSIFPNTA